MSLTHDHGNIVFQCDGKGCHETLETGTSNFQSALNMLGRARWQSVPRRKTPGSPPEWDHHCDGCKVKQHKLV